MTDDKPIIIDEVDVMKCEHWNICKQCQLSQLQESDYKLLCKDNPNCYFKQLIRKTQECEELKMAQIPKLTGDKEDNYQNMLQYMINALQEENETLHASIDEKQRVLDAFEIEYSIDTVTQEAYGRSKKFIELQNKLEEVQEKYDQLKAEKEQLEQKLKRILEVKESECDGIDCAWCTRVDCPREENN